MRKRDEKIAVDVNGNELVIDLQDFPHGKLFDRRKDDRYDIEFYTVPDSIRVPSYDPTTGTTVWMPVKCWSVHRGKKLELVTLSDGSQIYTDNDPRAIYGVAADGCSLVPERFTPSVAMQRRVLIPVTTDSQAIDYRKLAWYDLSTGVASDSKSDMSVMVDFDFGQFVGIMVGDGWADVERKAYLADSEGYNALFVSTFLSKVYSGFTMPARSSKAADTLGRYGDTVKYHLAAGDSSLGRRIKELVDGHGDEDTSGSANKRLPMWYQFAGRDFIEGLVCGMIATDGTVAVSRGKGKPQLQIQYNTTSLRLAREFQRCCRLLGCRCSVSFSKRTSGGNTAWLCIVSTVDAKKCGLLNRCCHDRKRDTFMSTVVTDSACNVHNDVIPFPTGVSREIIAGIPTPEVRDTEELKAQYSLSINVRKWAKEGRISRHFVREAVRVGGVMARANEEARDNAIRTLSAVQTALSAAAASGRFRCLRDTKVAVSRDVADVLRDGVKACQTRAGDKKVAGRQLTMLYNVRNKGVMTVAQADGLAEFFANAPAQTDLRDSTALAQLVKLADSSVRWESIVKVEKTDVEEVGYDLTVPGYDTFVNADGVVLSNTMNFHVPSSDKAVEEAIEKMLPSKNLFSTTDLRSPRYVPMMEMTLGLAKLTAPASKAKPRVFVTKQDAIRAYRRGEIGANDPISVLGTN